jgi:hypothetical protein
MLVTVLHAGDPHLPMTVDTASLALGLGFIVALAIFYDYYRREWRGET